MTNNARPICCIDHQSQRLYAELVQLDEARQVAWLRPLALIDTGCHEGEEYPSEQATVYDLQGEADLLCSPSLLREALDTEVVPVLSQIAQGEKSPQTGHLRQFLQQIYLEAPDRFGPAGQ